MLNEIFAPDFRLFLKIVGFFFISSIFLSCENNEPETTDKPLSTKQIQIESAASNTPAIPFVEVAKKLGVEFQYRNGATGKKWAPETMIGGIAFLDYDNDNDPDLLAVSGTSWEYLGKNNGPVTIALFRNNSGESFTEVTHEVGLDFNGYGISLAVGDFDNDGWQDIFVAALGKNRLYKNKSGARFEDVTDQMRVSGDAAAMSIGAAFFDADNDGDLDLYVVNYMKWSMALDLRANELLSGINNAYAGPDKFESDQSYFYRNDETRKFSELSDQAGFSVKANNKLLGKPLGLLPVDLNNDHYIDLLVANDQERNFAFINDTKGGFVESAEKMGIAYNNLGKSTAAMGIDVAWLSPPQNLTVAMGNYAGEMTSFYTLDKQYEVFTDDAPVSGIGPKSRSSLSFGVLFNDFDLDGLPDLVQVNGHVEPDIAQTQQSQTYKQSAQLFWNCGESCSRSFVLLAKEAVGDLYEPIAGRGLASADIDNDGDLDLAISEVGGQLRIFRNDQYLKHNWLKLRLKQADQNRFAYGAVVEVLTGTSRQKQLLMPSRSYTAQLDSVLVFGLGASEKADEIKITWPQGSEQVLKNVAANQMLEIVRQ